MSKTSNANKKARRKWYLKNREKILAEQKQKRQTPEYKEKQHDNYLKNRDRRLEICKKYRLNHPEKISESKKKYYSTPGVMERIKKNGKERWNKKRRSVIEHYGGKCACCGESKIEFLAIDHINGGGTEHRKAFGSGHLYNWLIKENFPEGYRVLCYNCNTALGHYGYCPHSNLVQAVLPRGRSKVAKNVKEKQAQEQEEEKAQTGILQAESEMVPA